MELSVGLFGDQRAGNVVAVTRALFTGVARRHRAAVGVEQHAGEQARPARSSTGVALGGVVRELRLNRIPQRLVDDRRVFAGMRLSLVNDLAEIGTILQNQVERAAREWLSVSTDLRNWTLFDIENWTPR